MNEIVTVSMEKRTEQLNVLLLAQKADLTIRYESIWKNNERLDAYVLMSSRYNCCPTIYRNDDWYQKSDDEVVEFLKKSAERFMCNIDIDGLMNRDTFMNQALPRLVSASNEEHLIKDDIAYIKFLDMCVLFFIPLEESDSIGCITIKNRVLKALGISLEDIHFESIRNLESQVEIKNMMEVLTQMEKFDFPVLEIGFLPMWVCTNKFQRYGAAAILCQSVLRKLELKLGGKFFIFPSSIHEVIAVPCFDEVEQLPEYIELVNEINMTEVHLEDKLTDSVYIFKNGTLMIAE